MLRIGHLAGAVWALAAATLWAQTPTLDDLRLNQIQVVATHNSYHLRPPVAMLRAAMALRKDAKEWDYSRETLDQQLDRGIRSFELDLHVSDRGWQVLHVPTFDPGTTTPMLADALRVICAWSEKHPRHIPISLLLELKEEGYQVSRSFRRPQLADLEQLDAVLREGLGPARMLVPDDVRGQHATLREAVLQGGWPTIAEARGRVLVILHEGGLHRAAYLQGHEALEGRAMFVESDLDQPHAAVLIRNDPTDREIDALARKGFLIRTRVDTQGSRQAERRQQALASGAHILTTDYPRGEIAADQAFALPDGAVARVNPITGPEQLRGMALSEPGP
ncbi:MAG: phosphatidylinositol-specific phospholipase C1-like protein [Pirellulales bacterium]|nr:phosphatidylinositol-specific phospholipase C1-like protein [Pirellulales bacterium]